MVEKVKSEEEPQAVDYNNPKLEETLIVSMSQIKIHPLFPQWLKDKIDDSKFQKFLAKYRNLSIIYHCWKIYKRCLGILNS